MKAFSLPLSNLKQLNFNNYERDFDFIYEHEIFSCNKIIADFISPIVNKIHLTDPSVDHFEIPDNKHYSPSIFKEVINSGELKEIQITEKNAKALQYFYNVLGNNEFSKFILFNQSNKQEKKSASKSNSQDSINQNSDLNINSVFQILRIKASLETSINQEIDFIASHLYELEKKMETENSILTVDILQMIFGSPHICISSEEWIFNYIMKRVKEENNKEFVCLFEFVKFNHLPKKSVEIFFNTIPIDEMNQSVYNSIIDLAMKSFKSPDEDKNDKDVSHRYYEDPKQKEEKEKEKKKKSKDDNDKKVIQMNFNFDRRNPLNGVFNYLRTSVSNGQNIASSGIIDITSSSNNTSKGNSDLKHLVDRDSSTIFVSNNEPNQWITFDFKNRKIVPRLYTLVTINEEKGGNHMKTWVIEVSDDNVNFSVITTETNNITLNGRTNLVVFRAFNPQKGRYVRIRQTGPNWGNSNVLSLTQVEFYGDLFEQDDK